MQNSNPLTPSRTVSSRSSKKYSNKNLTGTNALQESSSIVQPQTIKSYIITKKRPVCLNEDSSKFFRLGESTPRRLQPHPDEIGYGHRRRKPSRYGSINYGRGRMPHGNGPEYEMEAAYTRGYERGYHRGYHDEENICVDCFICWNYCGVLCCGKACCGEDQYNEMTGQNY